MNERERAIADLDKVYMSNLRKSIDPGFLAVQDELDDVYYNHWKLGQQAVWQGYTYPGSPEASKALFDRLIGLLWTFYEVALKEANDALDTPYEKDASGEDFGVRAFMQLPAMKTEDINAYNRVRARVIALGHTLDGT